MLFALNDENRVRFPDGLPLYDYPRQDSIADAIRTG